VCAWKRALADEGHSEQLRGARGCAQGRKYGGAKLKSQLQIDAFGRELHLRRHGDAREEAQRNKK
jgi:hypothetical protein